MTIFFGKTAVHLSFLLDFKNIILNVVSIEKIIKIARFLTKNQGNKSSLFALSILQLLWKIYLQITVTINQVDKFTTSLPYTWLQSKSSQLVIFGKTSAASFPALKKNDNSSL